MRRRLLGFVLLLVGLLVVAAAALAVVEARGAREEAHAACAARGESGWCGAREGYLSALALALGPFLALPGLGLALGGLVLVALPSGKGAAETGRQTVK